MPAREYPFVEIAVLPAIRDRFAEGQALAVFSPDIDYVYWANGAAARRFGYDTIYAFLEDENFEETVLARQIAAAAGQIAHDRPKRELVLRIGAGFRRIATPCAIERIDLPAGEPAYLLIFPPDPGLKDSLARANSMIAGFAETQTHVAVLDGEANALAQSPAFDNLRLDPSVLETLIFDVDREPSHLLKRAVVTASGRAPAAIARLKDTPSTYLVFVVEQSDTRNAAQDGDASGFWQTAFTMDEPADAGRTDGGMNDAAPPSPHPQERVPQTRQFVFNPSGRPVRFVWKIDAGGRFSDISPEFADTVGPAAADVVGRTFADLAQVFNLDPDGVVTELLRRRDTWSGKTVLWPVEGSTLSLPVDLAALPTYTRERQFDGFRGFGVIRVADAVDDPERIGLALASARATPEPPPPVDRTPDSDPGKMQTPARHPAPPAGVDAPTTPPTPSNDDYIPDEVAARDAADGDVEDAPPSDPFRGEVPALKIVAGSRRGTDKVIDLQERRNREREGLSRFDHAIFHQIGEELGRRLADSAPASSASAGPADGGPKPQHAAEHVPYVALMRETGIPDVEQNRVVLPPAEPVQPVLLPTPPPAASASATRIQAAEHVGATVLTVTQSPFARDDDATFAFLGISQEPVSEAPAETPDRPVIAAGADAETPVETATHFDVAPQSAAAGRAVMTQGLVDALPVPLLLHRGDELLHANPRFLEFTGYRSLSELNEAGGLDILFRPGEARLVAEEPAHPLAGLVLTCADGAMRQVGARLQSVGWQDGHALLLAVEPAAVFDPAMAGEPADMAFPDADDGDARQDATRLSTAETEVGELRSILETATDGVVILDENGAIRSMNRSASALFDYNDEETTGQPFAMLFAHESQRTVLDYISGLAGNGVASVLNDGREVIGREASSGFIPLFMTIGRLGGSNGYCAVIRDITHWKRTEDELRGAKRAAEAASAHKSEFLARVSHEIRTPLNAIIGFAEMMATERFGPIGHPRYQEYAHDIGRSGRHVLDIVNDLLDISKIEAGEQQMDFAAVSLNETLAEAVSLMQPQANAQRVIIRTSLSSTLPDVVADERSIKQIAINLLSNAVRFTPSGGQIVVSTVYDDGGQVVMRVRDTGNGMSRIELDQAMKPFRQGAAAPSRPRGDGTGLGLPLTKAMVEANRAQFSIDSTPGEGTLVQVAFPSQRVLAE